MDKNKKTGTLSWYFGSSLLLRILIGLILGAIAGLLVGPSITSISFLGTILIRLLKMIVMPIILLSLIAGATSLTPARLGKIGLKILLFYAATSAVAVIIGLFFSNLFNVGAGMNLVSVGQAVGKSADLPKFVDTLLDIIPQNPFGVLSSGAVFPVIFFSIIFDYIRYRYFLPS